MILRESIDDLDVLITELTELRRELSLADLHGNRTDVLCEVEAGLRHAANRAAGRADVVRRAIALLDRQRRLAS